MEKFLSFIQILGVNLMFVGMVAVVVIGLATWRRAAYAVLKRNFLAYFTSPTGYVFLCLFVWLTAVAAFWTEDFFNANLANLDQLNKYLPLILLVFIPAITMSIWSEERRQGTDELLLTIPAADFDIVLGKYLAAVAIFTVSLMFSEMCNFIVLSTLGSPDVGLLLGNYLGYWLAGLAMLSIGMVASFLTNNLTVGFVLGVLLNVPLVMANYADVIFGSWLGRILARWSISQQFADFQAGVVSFSSVLFFLLVTCVMFYLSLVLIGRRHWSGGRDGHSMGPHFFVRVVSLMLAVGAVCVLLSKWDPVRADLTSERLNSLHPDTIKLLEGLDPKYPVRVDAYVSRDLPEEFVERRVDLANVLREINALSHGRVRARLHEVDPFSEEAALAKAEYGIEARDVFTEVRGALSKRSVIFGVGVRSGLERVAVPFLGQGARIEHELIRAVVTVAEAEASGPSAEAKPADGKTDEKTANAKTPASNAKDKKPEEKKLSGRRRIGVLTTDAQLFGGGGSPMGGEESPDQPLIQELRRQYQVVRVDPNQEIKERFDVLLAVQPSSLSPEGMKHFIDAVRSGQPTAIFEDPMPMLSSVPGTSAPKRPQGGMPFMMQRPEPKGNIQPLWDLLGVHLAASENIRRTPMGPVADVKVAWQEYN
ncbi:MAG: Gldg family protein, partial [Planctomycetes bacterium]|nr:Gldg family protein [Planctomycetota bacterium]